MCLSVQINRPDCVLAQGKHAGHEFVVVYNHMGFRCGYVRITVSHPWFGKEYDEIDADIHGGLSFAESDVPCGKGDDDAYWVGFDCAHGIDAPDPLLPIEHSFPVIGGTVRTQEYVEAECCSLCEQAASVAV